MEPKLEYAVKRFVVTCFCQKGQALFFLGVNAVSIPTSWPCARAAVQSGDTCNKHTTKGFTTFRAALVRVLAQTQNGLSAFCGMLSFIFALFLSLSLLKQLRFNVVAKGYRHTLWGGILRWSPGYPSKVFSSPPFQFGPRQGSRTVAYRHMVVLGQRNLVAMIAAAGGHHNGVANLERNAV